MTGEILNVAQMYAADRFAAEHGTPSLTLMENAGRAVADEICRRWTQRKVAVLCGPGNNGGDGFVVARLLKERGYEVRLSLLGSRETLTGDAGAMARRWGGEVATLKSHAAGNTDLVVDALFGAGLSKPLEGESKAVALTLNSAAVPVVAIDVPSGLHGDSGRPLGDVCVQAGLTVTFFRKKPAHVLMPGRALCGEVALADIGIPLSALDSIRTRIFENTPALWRSVFPWPRAGGHKYARGHCAAVSGPAHATGAARLAARGALRAGAGLVSVASPRDAVAANAAHLTAIMVKPFAGRKGLAELLNDTRLNAVVAGPGCGVGSVTRELVAAILQSKAAAVLDAGALTSFAGDPKVLFTQLRQPAVLTPHEGEFERLFPGLLARAPTRIAAALEAAASASCTVLLKGPDTVIANAKGDAAICTNTPPWLATAGSGDVLAGIIAGLMAQGMNAFDAACAGAWLHGEAANCFGIGLIAEDIPEMLPRVLQALHASSHT